MIELKACMWKRAFLMGRLRLCNCVCKGCGRGLCAPAQPSALLVVFNFGPGIYEHNDRNHSWFITNSIINTLRRIFMAMNPPHLDLVCGAKNVGVILLKSPNSRQTRQSPADFVPEREKSSRFWWFELLYLMTIMIGWPRYRSHSH